MQVSQEGQKKQYADKPATKTTSAGSKTHDRDEAAYQAIKEMMEANERLRKLGALFIPASSPKKTG